MHDGEFEIPGYKSFRHDRGAAGGGIAVYVKNEITATRRDDLEDSTVERLWLDMDFWLGHFTDHPIPRNTTIKILW